MVRVACSIPAFVRQRCAPLLAPTAGLQGAAGISSGCNVGLPHLEQSQETTQAAGAPERPWFQDESRGV